MNRKIAIVPALLAALALSACGKDAGPSPSPEAPSCTGTLTWSVGSLPPPYAYTWSITIDDDGTGSFTYTPGYRENPTYEEDSIPLDPDKLAAFCEAVESAAPDDGSVGGPYMSWNLNASSGHTTDTDATVAAANALLGKERFDTAYASNPEGSDG